VKSNLLERYSKDTSYASDHFLLTPSPRGPNLGLYAQPAALLPVSKQLLPVKAYARIKINQGLVTHDPRRGLSKVHRRPLVYVGWYTTGNSYYPNWVRPATAVRDLGNKSHEVWSTISKA
jgi:hypothetical protein